MKATFDDTINAINGKNFSGNIPYSLWKHFPGHDLKVDEILTSHLEFQNQTESDLIKFSPQSKYCAMDWGLEIGKEYNTHTGSYIAQKYPINSITDWEKIDEVDPLDGHLGIQLHALSKFSKSFEHIPIMMTIFLPMMVADKLVSNNNLVNHLKEDPVLVKDRIKVINKTMTEFSFASLDAGSNGLFLATQHTQEVDGWNAKLWNEFVLPYDKTLIGAVNKKSLFTVLHFHGSNIFFDEVLKKIKINAMNWHLFDKLPSVLNFSKKKQVIQGLIGGMNEDLFEEKLNSETDMEEHVKNILAMFNAHLSQLIIAPGCVLPQNIPMEKLKLFLKKLKEIKIAIK